MNTLNLLVLLAILAIAVFCDIRVQKIPNALILAGLALGFGLSMLPQGLGVMQALGGFCIGFGIFLPLYAMRILGAGDVKLMAVVGAFLGVTGTIGAMLMGLAAGGVFAIGYAAFLGRLGKIFSNVRDMVFDSIVRVVNGQVPRLLPAQTQVKMPYSLAIASGVLIFVFVRYRYTGSIA
jgi:prepilin peptidase CpaA